MGESTDERVEGEEVIHDQRVEYMANYVMKALKVNHSKWNKMQGQEENNKLIHSFLERAEPRMLLVVATPAGALVLSEQWPEQVKQKACYFVKKSQDPVSKDIPMRAQVHHGDLSYSPVEQLSTFVEEVLVPLLGNQLNHDGWPRVVSHDLLRHVQSLKQEMYVITGEVQGKTLLPLPVNEEDIEEAIEKVETDGTIDMNTVHAFESIVIDWTYQIRNVLKKDSSEPILDGLNPTPKVEIGFWKAKAANLECIYDQLRDPKVRRMAEFLEKTDSSYFPAFKVIFREVVAALTASQDINLHLKPLSNHFQDYEQADFDRSEKLLAPMMHTVCLVWASSEYYRDPGRVIVLLQEICNMIIECAMEYVDPLELFKGDVEEELEKTRTALRITTAFKTVYEEHRAKLKSYFKDEQVPVEWEFTPKLVFTRYDQFLHRLEAVTELFETCLDLLKLEKIGYGGVKGKMLSDLTDELYLEFQDQYKVFTMSTYNCLDVNDPTFLEDYENFRLCISDMDRRLANIVCIAFDDCSNLEAVFRLIDVTGPLLERPLIKQEFDENYMRLVAMMQEHLLNIKDLYDEHIQALKQGELKAIHKNMPPVAGHLKWSSELKDRMFANMDCFKRIDHPCMESQQAKTVFELYEQLMNLLTEFEKEIFEKWLTIVDEGCSFNLDQPLIVRNEETNLIAVNFANELAAVLREVKYLEQRNCEEIPDSAAKLFQRNDELRKYTNNLDVTVTWYNKVRETTLEVEFPLIEEQLEAIDAQLKRGESELTWNSEGLWEYVQETRDMMHDLEQRAQKCHDNVDDVVKLMATWNDAPLVTRKDMKKTEKLADHKELTEMGAKRYAEITQAGKRIHALVQENLELFKADVTSETWKAYIDYIDEMIVDGFTSTVEVSLDYLLNNTESNQTAHLSEIQFLLQAPDMVFSRSIEFQVPDGFYDYTDSLIGAIYKQCSKIQRLSVHSGQPHYQPDIEDMGDLTEKRTELMTRVTSVLHKANEFRNSYEPYSYLWVDDRAEFMRQFLLYNHVLTTEEIEAHAEEGVPEVPPTLVQFKEQIDTYEKIYEEVSQFPDTQAFDTWFLIDAKPFKQALLNTIKRWSFMFKQHLIDHVTNSLADLAEFIKVSNGVLMAPVEEDDYDGLVDCMEQLNAVKERTTTTDEMFEPLQSTIELLRQNGQELPEEVHEQLQELPEKWNNTKKMSIDCKQHVAPLQTKEVANIRRKSASFDVKQHTFREEFRQIPPFFYDCTDPYKHLDTYQRKIVEIENEMASLQQAAALFEVNIPDYKQLKTCRKEIVLLKALWDTIEIVRSSIEDWKTTPWMEINVDQMETNCKKFAYDVRSLDKEMRAWDTFTGLEKTVRNMLTALKAVSELQNPAIRDRHWQQLMHATGVQFHMDEDTTLADLLALNLHNFEDQVQGIVDKAVKEMAMEKVLKELDVTWAAMEFEHEPHPTRGVTMLKAGDELIETLEENQVQLQNMLTSKFIAYFLKEVTEWQHKLSTADQVIVIWFEVQHTWSYLESIFIGSEDIRSQLPEDSKRFDGIDVDFRELVSEVEKTKNVVEATNMPNLYEKLAAILESLTLCEKALAEYLETKRLVFPRFYFCSSADLLDILSNGNQPTKVERHLTKLFDSMARLKFVEDAEGAPTKEVTAMWSKDGEYVDTAHSCDLSGQVEVWLNRLLDTMKDTVLHEMQEAVVSYEEKPRDQWIFDFPAQVALVGTQIWWTTEVNIAFGRLEEGYENALKDYNKKQVAQLNSLIALLLGGLSAGDRQKIMTICTIDVHARDVVSKLISQKVTNAQAFTWLCQLRHRWDDTDQDCFANICDAQFRYAHEYLGNTSRLVITPLTDRCYITLTQSLHLTMSGAPAGPAGTGKTETTKDLGRALGIMVYVFNCSEQMDYKSIGNIYKGLAQSGAWGCFDEFNRIAVEVLSVVAVQVKGIQDAIKAEKTRFVFQGEEISLQPTVGIFITMNPGYAGRTELPENLKALFRPCAMVVPDFELIAEIMMVAEGFTDARLLARKFITLYSLCSELLSKQDHYDWGLRAIKSVLVVAGTLRRGDPERPEDQVLMRALRDFNIPKIVSDDLPVFMGLIGDLFPALNVPRKRDMEFEGHIKQAVNDLHLQPEDSFVLKVVQLQELVDVRHSVFIIGNAGTGKTCVWKSLFKANRNMKKKPVVVDLNPKAVTNDELFGVINQATREWKDGLFSTIMRDLANQSGDGPKWIVLDGDIDPMWIESLNTVMDDNKVLTLASNERIPLTPSMRLVFEISHLKTANPSTVSRAGILYVNPADLGWNPYVSSWIDTREIQSERANLTILFDKYVPTCLDIMKNRFKKITPVADISHLQMLCYLLECMLTPENTPADCPREQYELYFVFCCVWAFGGCLFQDQLVDHRVDFTKWWVSEFKAVKFPHGGTVFDFYIDPATKKFEPWTSRVEPFVLDPDQPLQAAVVNTAETERVRFFLDMLIARRRPVMLVGGAGTGKTVLMNAKLASLGDDHLVTNVPFNFYTTSEMLQAVLEKPLERKTGRNYGPPGMKRLVYFIDDMNMPEVDKYFTVQPHTLIRQHLDYGHWYDRQKLTHKEIHSTQYVSCMNPTAGSFTINARLQRHFCVFAISFPGTAALHSIYQSIMSQHLQTGAFNGPVIKSCPAVVRSAVSMHNKVTHTFLPTAIKFHYVFNLRDLSNIFQGMLYAGNECVRSPLELVRLWTHETLRVYKDKLVDQKDQDTFDKLHHELIKRDFEDLEHTSVFAEPLLYCHFAQGDGKYMPVSNFEELSKTLVETLEGYNEVNAAMNLVLFEDAIFHILRISRILESPRGNALLIGVGGSGKQSLSRLASYLSELEVFQISLRKGYGVNELKVDLAALCMRAGVKSVPTTFLLTDSQIADEKFLVLVNDLLASGEIPGLYTDDDIETIINGVRNEVKGQGYMDTRENCWKFFIDRVRRQLKVVLCFSPVGSTLRVRCRKFPAIVNCTSIDWFHSWPKEALVSVSRRFLEEVELLTPEVADSVALFMAQVHQSVDDVSQTYMRNERRYNYTTPKSFLEQIYLYKNLLTAKHMELLQNMHRLENGLERLESTASQVEDLKQKLKAQEKDVMEKNQEANELLVRVGHETEKTNKEREIADEEEKKVEAKNQEVKEKQEICEENLKKAEPALQAAEEALNTLNKENLSELKAFASPVAAIVDITAAVMCLFPNKDGKPPRDRSWRACRAMIGKAEDFLKRLKEYDKDNIAEQSLKAVGPYLEKPDFNPETIYSKSTAAAGLCSWVINIVKYYEVYCIVKPLRDALDEANAQLTDAQKKLADVKAKVAKLVEEQQKLQSEFEKATEEKLKCQQSVEHTHKTIELANRLVGGLASENVRWAESVEKLKMQEKTLPGDVLLISAFVSYAGCFTKRYRSDLMDTHWLPFLTRSAIQVTEDLDPLTMLTDDATVAAWNNESLPSDRMSTENATILTNCERWPLMIDPQLQGLKWIKQKYGDELVLVRLGQKNYLDIIERAISSGDIVLLENIEESVDPVLDPLLGRNTIKKGRAIKLGDKEIDYSANFRLLLHTKLANPHYKPEMQAQTTLINFTVTRDGLEDQLLAAVVGKERKDLEDMKAALTKQQNEFKIRLKELEDNLLARLSTAEGNFLGDYALVENLESTKRTAVETEEKVKEALITEQKINETREVYRPAAARSSLLYFILNDLHKIHPMYQFSLKAFTVVFHSAIDTAPDSDNIKERVENLIDCITYAVFLYTTRGLFEKDKLIFTTQMTFLILMMKDEIDVMELDFLLRYPADLNVNSPVDFLSHSSWGGIKALSLMPEFQNLDRDIDGSAKRWKKFVESECPEKEKFPQEWKNKSSLQKLCMMRALRPDRMTYAMRHFIEEHMGSKYVELRQVEFAVSYKESSPSTPIFFILSPGVDPLKDVEALGKKLKFTQDRNNFHNISLGQGQETVAEQAMDLAAKEGHWVVLQNVHLVAKWLGALEKKLEESAQDAHRRYRVFISAEPAPTPDLHIIPAGILESAVKITNEPPTGMLANLHQALDNFDQDTLEMCAREAEFKAILFALCYFHAVVSERRKFGPQGWNRIYPYNTGDLTISCNVLYNYLEANTKVPWEDLRYLFGEIMYGGHITDDWDRRLCRTYLEEYMNPEIMEGELYLAPGFPIPPNSDYDGYHAYIDETLPPESPYLYGLHPNAEIEFLTMTSENLLRTVLEMQPRDSGSGGGSAASRDEKIKTLLDDILVSLPEEFNLQEIQQKVPPDERTPYTIVAFQECERMNILTSEMKRSLKELDLGLKGELTITADMESLGDALYLDTVPERWARLAYPSLHGLTQWYGDLQQRIGQLEQWSTDFQLPPAVWLAGLFNPQSFLTAIMQQTARKNEWPLDKMALQCDVTKKSRDDIGSPPREGAYIHGLYMEGARWNIQTGMIGDANLKELNPAMPIIFLKAVPIDRLETKNVYECPVYKTKTRGPTYVWTFNLKTKEKPAKWILGGVALILQI